MAEKDEAESLGDKVKRLAKKAASVATESYTGAVRADERTKFENEEVQRKKDKDREKQDYWCKQGDKASCDELKKYSRGGVVKARGTRSATRGCNFRNS